MFLSQMFRPKDICDLPEENKCAHMFAEMKTSKTVGTRSSFGLRKAQNDPKSEIKRQMRSDAAEQSYFYT